MRIFLFVFLTGLSFLATAQTVPQKMNYQAVARNASGTPLVSQSIGVKAEVLAADQSTVLYAETHNVTTNQFGLFTLQIGGGSVTAGTFASINWGNGNKFIRTSADITGGTNYQLMGSSQLLSVPYALYAGSSKIADSLTNMPQGIRIGFNSSTSWTCPAGVNLITVECWGGGGAAGWFYIHCAYQGGPYDIYRMGGDGGKGGYTKATVPVIPGNVYTITVGAGGAVGNSTSTGSNCSINLCPLVQGGQAGGAGSATSFHGIVTAPGGAGGTSATSSQAGTNGADGTVVNYTYPSVNYGTRTYIPSNYLFPVPTYAPGGGNFVYQGSVPCPLPAAGENGYLVISY